MKTKPKRPQGGFLSQLKTKAPSGAGRGKFTWARNESGRGADTPSGAPAFNRQQALRAPAPTSDIPIKPDGEIDLARVRQTVQAKSKRFNKQK